MDFDRARRIISDATRELKSAIEGFEQAYLNQHADDIFVATRSMYEKHYSRSWSSQDVMKKGLELLHSPVLRDRRDVLELLVRAAQDLDPFGDESVANTLAGCLTLAVRQTALELDDDLRRGLSAAGKREEAFGWGSCVTLTVLSYPYDPDRVIEVLRGTSFKAKSDTILKHHRWFIRHASGARFAEVLATFYDEIGDASIAFAFDDLGEENARQLEDALLAIAEYFSTHHSWAERELCQLVARLELRDAAPLVAWIIRDGHRLALDEAIAALGALGSPEWSEVLEVPRERAWSPETRRAAEEARAALSQRSELAGRTLHDRLAALLEERPEPTGFDFDERQLLDVCTKGVEGSDDDEAQARVDGDVVEEFFEMFSRKLRQHEDEPELDEGNLRQAIWVASEPPFAFSPRADSQLTRALLSHYDGETRNGALGSLFYLAKHGRLQPSEHVRERLMEQAHSGHWSGRRLLQILTCALPDSRGEWVAQIDELGGFNDVPHEEHVHLLNLPSREKARALLELFYARCDETQFRGLMRKLDVAAYEPFLPIWVGMVGQVSASTRKLLVQRIAEAELLTAEPFLQQVVSDGGEDVSVRATAAWALGKVGSRLSLAALLEAQQVRALRKDATEAIEAIEARYPAADFAAGQGALSLAGDGGVRGALSLMGADEGAISLYEEVQAALEAPRSSAGEDRAPSVALARSHQRADIARLSAPPRSVWRARIAYIFLGHSLFDLFGVLFIYFGILTSAFAVANDGTLWCTAISLLIGAVWLYSNYADARTSRYIRALRSGYVAMGEKTGRRVTIDRSGESETKTYHYDFRFMAENGEYYTFTQDEEDLRAALEDESEEPILYVPDRDGEPTVKLPLDAIRLVRIDRKGRLRLSAIAIVLLTGELGGLVGILWWGWTVIQS